MQHTRIQPLGEERAHYWMVQRMARATGTDLVRAFDEGALSPDQWAATVGNCRGCGWTEGCDHWLDGERGVPRPVPQACPNAALFERLAGHMR
ncbi:hypothetical protein HKCCE2091_07615 [Rhodobacterales bacterium HKCCE2091]|nr:hypothetical protein [Rhodobacterales bacterium HKCCE2091]